MSNNLEKIEENKEVYVRNYRTRQKWIKGRTNVDNFLLYTKESS